MTDQSNREILLPPAKTAFPQLRSALIDRPALQERISTALAQRRLVILSAPAGFGKTTALVRALNALGDNSTPFWISADDDDDLQRFLSAFIQALEPVDVPWRISAQGMLELAAEGESGPGRLADAVANALSATDIARGVIAIDDVHRLKDELVINWLDRLIERLPPNWTIAIATRFDPAVSLARLKSRGELAEFRNEDLRFALAEFESLASSGAEGAAAAAADISTVWEKMSGWPVGCDLALRVGISRAATSGAGTAAFDVLSTEVLDQLPDGLRRFLLKCSILPELSAPLCAAVSGDSDSVRWLREIVQRGLFATALPGDPPAVRLHDLFRELLQSRLREEFTADAVRDLLVRAARAEDNPERRIGFLCEAGDFAAAEKELVDVANSLLLESERERVMSLIGLFPAQYSDASAEISFIAGLCASSHSSWIETQRLMARAAEIFRQSGDMDMNRRARAHEIVAFIGLAMSQEAMIRLAALEQEETDTETQALCAFAHYWVSRVFGTVQTELRFFDRMFHLLLKSNDPIIWNECALHLYLGGQRGMRIRAERYATAILAVSGENHDSLRDSGLSMRSCYQLLVGDYAGAASLIREIEGNQNWRGKPHSVRTFVYVAKSLVAYLAGDVEALRESGAAHLAEFGGREGVSWAYWRGTALLFVGKLLAALDDWASVRSILEKLDAEVQILDTPYLRLGRSYLELLCLLDDGETNIPDKLVADIAQRPIAGDIVTIEPALDAVRALVHARRREFADAWSIITSMVTELQESGEEFHLILLGRSALTELANIPFAGGSYQKERDVLKTLISKLDTTRTPLSGISGRDTGGLTSREFEILELIALGDSNKVIARKHDLSPHTVKRHVANILDKLGLASRGQAAAWFRDHALPAERGR